MLVIATLEPLEVSFVTDQDAELTIVDLAQEWIDMQASGPPPPQPADPLRRSPSLSPPA